MEPKDIEITGIYNKSQLKFKGTLKDLISDIWWSKEDEDSFNLYDDFYIDSITFK